MPRRDVRGRILDEAAPLLGARRLSREFSTQDPGKLAEELARLVDAVEGMSAEYAAPRLQLLPVVYEATTLALGFIAPIEPGSATVTARLPHTAPAFAGCSLAVAKRGTTGSVLVTRRSTDQLLHGNGDEVFFACSEPGLYVFFTDGERWYRDPDWKSRIDGVQNLLTIGSPRLLGRYSAGVGLAQQITIDDSLEMTVGGALQRAALTGDVTAPAGSNATTLAASAATLRSLLGWDYCIAAALGYTASTTVRQIPFTSEVVDTAGFHDNVTNNTRFTAPTNGIYTFQAGIWSNTSTTTLSGSLRLDGSSNLDRAEGVGTTFGAPYVKLWWAGSLNAGQYIELQEDWGAAPTGNARVMMQRLAILP